MNNQILLNDKASRNLSKRFTFNIIFAPTLILLTVGISGCKTRGYDNFTTYFNTFYNEERLMKECESEFEFQDEKKRAKPKIIVPMPMNPILNKLDGATPTFLAGLKVDKAARQAVKTKMDSILIKGSKILANSPKSNYVAPSLFLMAKTYFYQEEWLPSQIKCSELIDKEPTGQWSPDAHLLMAMNLLMQGKYEAGLTMLSRTVDVSWLNNRYDILTKSFNIEAEMALYYGDLDGAIRPYFQAIAQSDDNLQKAIWQNEMAGILFRMHKFERAEKAYAKVMKFSPDITTEYESKLYRASCLIRLGRTIEADRILNILYSDGKFEEWQDYVMTQRQIKTLLGGTKEQIKILEFTADSLFQTSVPRSAYFFEKGLQEFEAGDYVNARSNIAKAKQSGVTMISQPANKMFLFMNQREVALKNINDNFTAIEAVRNAIVDSAQTSENSAEPSNITDNTTDSTIWVDSLDEYINKVDETKKDNAPQKQNFTQQTKEEQIDKLFILAAHNYFELARVHYNIGNFDSANYYYKSAADVAPKSEANSSRYLYVYSESIRDTNVWMADSILDVIVNTQPKTEYGKIALAKLGYTSAFITDTVANIYNSGYDLMKYKEFEYAKAKLRQVYTDYPSNQIYAPKALYALGYMFENDIQQFDSAQYYYQILIEKYPTSEYAKELALPVKYKDIVDKGGTIPDSLKTKDIVIYTADTTILSAPYDSTLLSKPKTDDGFSFDDLKNPSKLLEKTKKKLQEKLDKAQKTIDNPEGIMDDLKNKASEGLKDAIKIPKPEDFLPKEEGKEGENSDKNKEHKPEKEQEKVK